MSRALQTKTRLLAVALMLPGASPAVSTAQPKAMAVFSGDSTPMRNITFSNIRVDRIEEGKLINIVAGNNARYNKAAGRRIDGVTLRNISFTGEGMPSRSVISGLSPQTAVTNVTMENLSIAGRRVSSTADFDIGPHVNGMSIR